MVSVLLIFVLYLEALARKGDCMLIRISADLSAASFKELLGSPDQLLESPVFLAVGPRYIQPSFLLA